MYCLFYVPVNSLGHFGMASSTAFAKITLSEIHFSLMSVQLEIRKSLVLSSGLASSFCGNFQSDHELFCGHSLLSNPLLLVHVGQVPVTA